uniref:Uncharacterized protein n=1 Tax=Arundo donax TaxID=35708 RepID=A0A0A8Z268_ARUDO
MFQPYVFTNNLINFLYISFRFCIFAYRPLYFLLFTFMPLFFYC